MSLIGFCVCARDQDVTFYIEPRLDCTLNPSACLRSWIYKKITNGVILNAKEV